MARDEVVPWSIARMKPFMVFAPDPLVLP
jgi:hypothetical protein